MMQAAESSPVTLLGADGDGQNMKPSDVQPPLPCDATAQHKDSATQKCELEEEAWLPRAVEFARAEWERAEAQVCGCGKAGRYRCGACGLLWLCSAECERIAQPWHLAACAGYVGLSRSSTVRTVLTLNSTEESIAPCAMRVDWTAARSPLAEATTAPIAEEKTALLRAEAERDDARRTAAAAERCATRAAAQLAAVNAETMQLKQREAAFESVLRAHQAELQKASDARAIVASAAACAENRMADTYVAACGAAIKSVESTTGAHVTAIVAAERRASVASLSLERAWKRLTDLLIMRGTADTRTCALSLATKSASATLASLEARAP